MSSPKRKRCATCKKLRKTTEFPPSPRHRGGLYPYCHACHAAYQSNRHPNRAVIDTRRREHLSLRSQQLKRCTKCREIKSYSEFLPDTRHSDGLQSHCKACWTLRSNERYLLKEYGLTTKEFDTLFLAQHGVCAICGRSPKRNRFNIDHSHRTHVIRALLCVNCNTNLLPYVEYQGETIKKAFQYLEDPPAPKVLGIKLVPQTNQARRRARHRT